MKKRYVKLAVGRGALCYCMTVGRYFVPPTWHPSTRTVFTTCPACVLTVTVDPSWASVALILAPIDAIVYGAVGIIIGLILEGVRRRSGQRGEVGPDAESQGTALCYIGHS